MSSRSIGRMPVLVLAGGLVLMDQISKAWMSQRLSAGDTITALPGLLDLQLVHNTGAAFSLLTGSLVAVDRLKAMKRADSDCCLVEYCCHTIVDLL